MAKYHGRVSEALTRWATPSRLDVHTDVTYDGLYAATLTVQTNSAEIVMTVTSVSAASGARSSMAEVQDIFDRFTQAPGDAVELASEMQRLRKQVEQLKKAEVASRSGEQPPPTRPGESRMGGGTIEGSHDGSP